MKQCVLSLVLCLVTAFEACSAEEKTALQPNDLLDYMIVVTGGELLEGVYPDAHTPFITRTLRPMGCRCVGAISVDDQSRAIQEALRFATNQARLVIVTGGLGPTPNDITRETISAFCGIPLQENEEVLSDMERRFSQPRAQLRPNLRRQALVPTRGTYLKNASGTAVGLVFEHGATTIVALPGPPRELQTMVSNELVPYLRRRFGIRALGYSLTLRFVGAGQSLIDQTIKDHVSVAPDVTITSLFEGSRVDFTFSVPGHDPADEARLKKLEKDIREHLEQYVYADDGSTLEEVVLRKLRSGAAPMVLVDVGTGGQLAAALYRVPFSGQVLCGAYSAHSAEAMNRLLNEKSAATGAERAIQLARAAAKAAKAKRALAVGPTEGDGDVKNYWVALVSAEGEPQTRQFPARSWRGNSRDRVGHANPGLAAAGS